MNTVCLITSRLSLFGAALSLVAVFATGSVFFLGLLLVLAALSLAFHTAYGNYRSNLRVLEKETEVTGLADLLEPDE